MDRERKHKVLNCSHSLLIYQAPKLMVRPGCSLLHKHTSFALGWLRFWLMASPTPLSLRRQGCPWVPLPTCSCLHSSFPFFALYSLLPSSLELSNPSPPTLLILLSLSLFPSLACYSHFPLFSSLHILLPVSSLSPAFFQLSHFAFPFSLLGAAFKDWHQVQSASQRWHLLFCSVQSCAQPDAIMQWYSKPGPTF